MKQSPGACCGVSLERPWTRCAWGVKKCLPLRKRRNGNWVGRSFRSMRRYAGRYSGFGTMDTSRVAIVAALEREVRPLVKGWRVREQEFDGRHFRFFERDNFVLVAGGIGAEAARRAAEAV